MKIRASRGRVRPDVVELARIIGSGAVVEVRRPATEAQLSMLWFAAWCMARARGTNDAARWARIERHEHAARVRFYRSGDRS